jgi:SAM-dependent methyltransferase
MHPIVFEAFENLLSNIKVNNVLEIGTPKIEKDSLLSLQIFKDAKKTAIDFSGPYKSGKIDVLKADATKLPFPDVTFDLILCNSVLEHMPKFWLALDEFKRVLQPLGILAIGVPSFGKTSNVLQFHAYPDDFYRFSHSAFELIFLNGFLKKKIIEVMNPPRLVGYGIKP